MEQLREAITYDQFDAVDIRVGRITRVEDFPKARQPSYRIWMDFGPLGERKSSARLTKLYTQEQLVGKLVLAVLNFPPRQIADFMSEVLVLGIGLDAETVALVQPDREVPLGGRLF
jgi:tRNA-binding protein